MALSNLNQTYTCPPPFLREIDFPWTGTVSNNRMCASYVPGESCCLPCPMTNWVYPDNFLLIARVAQWLNVPSLAFCVFLLLSFAFLPVQKTQRNYLTVCLVFSVAIMSISFIIPLATKPDQCYDAITPNDMRSDISCAFSGALVLTGGFAAVTWVFLRALSMYLQICWQIIPGDRFFYASLLSGWTLTGLVIAFSLVFCGVSYRFGETCHINHQNDYIFWVPLLVLALMTLVLQAWALIYCMRVFYRSMMVPERLPFSENSKDQHSNANSVKTTVSARAAYLRVRKVLVLQWRSIVIVSIVVICVTYFSTIFLKMDLMVQAELNNTDILSPWIFCLIANDGDKNACLDLASNLVLSESTTLAVLYMLAVIGFWCLLFLGRWSMVTGWRDSFLGWFSFAGGCCGRRGRQRLPSRQVDDPAPTQCLTMTKGSKGLVVIAKPVESDILDSKYLDSVTRSPTIDDSDSSHAVSPQTHIPSSLRILDSPEFKRPKSLVKNFSSPRPAQNRSFSPTAFPMMKPFPTGELPPRPVDKFDHSGDKVHRLSRQHSQNQWTQHGYISPSPEIREDEPLYDEMF